MSERPVTTDVGEAGVIAFISFDKLLVSLAASYARSAQQLRDRRRRTLAGAGVDEVALSTRGSYVAPLLHFFRQRERAR